MDYLDSMKNYSVSLFIAVHRRQKMLLFLMSCWLPIEPVRNFGTSRI